MPRPLRLEFENAWYHVMNRGAGHREIFKADKHREIFLDLLEEASSLFGVKVHAYCLMDNHYHLLLSTPRANLSRIMRHINGLYTQKFNRSEKHDGPLFRGRYKAIVVDSNSYLLQVSRYIHLNPVIAKIVKKPEMYKWSSYASYLQKKGKLAWLVTEEVISMLSQRNKIEAYQGFVMSGLDQETELLYAKENTPAIYGSKKFKKDLLKKLSRDEIKASSTHYNITLEPPLMDEICRAVADFFNVEESVLYQGCRGVRNDARNIAIYACRVWGSGRLSVIAEHFHCDSHSNISNAVKEIKDRVLVDDKLASIVRRVKKGIF
jgi:REP element-mobilizing transposase RayT